MRGRGVAGAAPGLAAALSAPAGAAALGVALWLTAEPATALPELPPVTYSGELRTEVRLNVPEDEQETLQRLSSANLRAETFVWQPWFATVGTRAIVSQSKTYAERDSDALVLGGGATLRLFPVSRFPFEAFVDVTDSRSELDDPLQPRLTEFRTTRLGLSQAYRPRHGRSSYRARLERITQSDEAGATDVIDLLRLDSAHRFNQHTFDFDANVEKTRREAADIDTLNTVVTGRHRYLPNTRLSLENTLDFIDLDTEAPGTDSRFTRANFTSLGVWRAADLPLVVNTDVGVATDRQELQGSAESTLTSALRVDADYELTPRLRLIGSVGGRFRRADTDSSDTFQEAEARYRSGAIPLRGFTYDWFASGTADNRTETDIEAVQRVGAALGHSLSRSIPLGERSVVSAAVSQSGTSNRSTDVGTSHTLDHNASADYSRSAASGISTLRLNLIDSRSFADESRGGGTDSKFQSAGLFASHLQTLGRHASVTASASWQVNRQSIAGNVTTTRFSNASATYEHRRVFGVPRLQFRSELQLSADNLVPVFAAEEDDPELSWDNRLDYRIGRLTVLLRGTLIERRDSRDVSVFLSVRRALGGVF